MKTFELIRLFGLLSPNKNAGRLSNKAKIEYIKNFNILKQEMKVVGEAEGLVFEKYGIVPDANGDATKQINALEEQAKKDFVAEWNDLHNSDIVVILTKMDEADFCELITEKDGIEYTIQDTAFIYDMLVENNQSQGGK